MCRDIITAVDTTLPTEAPQPGEFRYNNITSRHQKYLGGGGLTPSPLEAKFLKKPPKIGKRSPKKGIEERLS